MEIQFSCWVKKSIFSAAPSNFWRRPKDVLVFIGAALTAHTLEY